MEISEAHSMYHSIYSIAVGRYKTLALRLKIWNMKSTLARYLWYNLFQLCYKFEYSDASFLLYEVLRSLFRFTVH